MLAAMRFGLLGTGSWARDVHAPGIATHPGAEFVGVWGRRPEAARAVAEPHGAAVFEQVGALLAEVDAVAIALPPDVQAELAVEAADAGRHLLMDKPIALSAAAADGVAEAVERAGVRSVVFFTARFQPEPAAWLADVQRTDDWLGAAVTLLVDIYEPGNPFGQSPWRKEKGALWDVGPHALDMVIGALGPVEDVVAEPGPGDAVHLVTRHASGAAATLSLSLTTPEPAQASSWRVYGPRGISERPEGEGPPEEAFAAAVSALLAEGPDGWAGHPADVRHGRDVVRVLDAAERFLAGRTAREPAAG
jgi:predicted dehydrogenase